MSFRVIMKGAANARLSDIGCGACGHLIEDVWSDDLPASCPKCKSADLAEVFVRSAMIDFHETKPIKVDGVGTFRTYRAMEQWEKRHDKTIMTPSRWEQLPCDTAEERADASAARIKEAVAKTHYRLKHGYVKPVKNRPESEVVKEP